MKSMTGFGRAHKEINNREYIVEIRSVNHKYSDLNIRMPRNIGYFEDKIRKEVLKNVTRGKIDVSITFNNYSDEGKKVRINHELVKEYLTELKELAEENELNKEIRVIDLVRMPDVFNLQVEEDGSDIIWMELNETLQEAIAQFLQMRQEEGKKIQEDLEERRQKIENLVEQISLESTGLLEDYVVKLEERIKEILKTDVVDQTRLAQETVIYSDKVSIEEELTRLKSHLLQMKNLLQDDQPIGKKLDFLIQEMNRETNTIGSKSGKLEITNLVIEIKTILEDIREQVQNIE